MNRNVIDLTEFVKLNAKFLHVFGYFYPEFKKASAKQILYFIYSVVAVVSVLISCLASQIAYLISNHRDISKIMEVSFLLFTHVAESFKLYCFLTYGSRIWKLLHTMNENIFQPKSDVQRDMLLHGIQTSKIISKAYLLICTLTCMSWSISPLTETREDKIRLPLAGWYPFRTDTSPNFEIVYIYQFFTAWFNGLAAVSMDTFAAGIIMFISAELSVLTNELETMKQETTEDNRRQICNHLVRNINHYKSIVGFAEEAMLLLSPGITCQFVTGVITSCTSMFQISSVPIPSYQFLGMCLYQTCMCVEMFLYCFYGNEVILKSDKLTQSAYMGEWVDAPKEFKQNLIIFMSRTQFPIELYAAGYFTLSIETFKSIAKTAWSYFVVLKQVTTE